MPCSLCFFFRRKNDIGPFPEKSCARPPEVLRKTGSSIAQHFGRSCGKLEKAGKKNPVPQRVIYRRGTGNRQLSVSGQTRLSVSHRR